MADAIKEIEIEADGFITRPEELEYTHKVLSTARLSKECIYPKCERCGHYREHFCTVPIVYTKQMHHISADLFARLEKRLTELENLVTDEILASDEETIDDLDFDHPTETTLKIDRYTKRINGKEYKVIGLSMDDTTDPWAEEDKTRFCFPSKD